MKNALIGGCVLVIMLVTVHFAIAKQTDALTQLTQELYQANVRLASQATLLEEVRKSLGATVVQADERVVSVTKIAATAKGYQVLTKASVEPAKTRELEHELYFSQEGPPLGSLKLFPNGDVLKRSYGFDVVVNSVILEEEGQTPRVVSKVALVPTENGLADTDSTLKKWKGVAYPLAITTSDVALDKVSQTKTLHLWTFNVNGSAAFKPRPSVVLGTNILGWGRSKQDLDWKLLQIGAEITQTSIKPHFTPASYRPLPSLLTNTYVGVGASGSLQNPEISFDLTVGF